MCLTDCICEKNLNKQAEQTYFELVEVVGAILSGQTLDDAGHWWVAQARPC